MHPLLESSAQKLGEGGKVKLAKLIGVSRQALHQWEEIPVERVLQVELVTGINRSVWRPDIYPPEDAKPKAKSGVRAA